MKNLFKVSRAGCAILLSLCMVMSFVTIVSADSAVIGAIGAATQTSDGYYSVTVPVSGVETGGDATILIHTGEEINKASIKYVNQEPTTEGATEFTAELLAGSYTILVGGTGVTSGTTTMDLNSPPVFAATTSSVSIDEGTATVGTYTATDYDGDTITYSLSGTDAASFSINSETGAVTTAVVFDYSEKSSYSFTVRAYDGTEYAEEDVAVTVTVKEVDNSIYISAYSLSETSGSIFVDGEISLPTSISYTAVDANDEEANGTRAITGWTYDVTPVATGGIYTAGQYVATPTFAANALLVDEDVTVPTYTLTISKYTITAFAAITTTIEKTAGTAQAGLGLVTSVDATATVKGTVAIPVTWACDDYDADTPGEYTFVATPDLGSLYILGNEVAVSNVTVTLVSTIITVTSYGSVDAITSKYVGTVAGDLGLPTEIKAIYGAGESDFVMLDVEWTCATYNALATTAQTFTGDVTYTEDYEADGDLVAPTVSVTLKKHDITNDYSYGTIKVSADETYEDYYEDLPTTISVAIAGYAEAQEITIVWDDNPGQFPPTLGETLIVYATFTDTDYITSAGKTFSVTFKTVDKNLSFIVNDSTDASIIAQAGEDSQVEALYYDDAATYAFVVTNVGIQAEKPADESFAAINTFSFGKDETVGATKRVTVFVKIGEDVVAKASTLVYFAASIYYGSVYADATAENPTYTALRTNNKAGLTATANYQRYDGKPVIGNYTAELRNKENTVLLTKAFDGDSAYFTPADLGELRGSYRLFVVLKDAEDNVLFEWARTVNLGTIGVWYSDMRTNGKAGAQLINRNKAITQEITFEELPGNKELYVGYDIAPYGTSPDDKALTDRTIDGSFKYSNIDASGIELGTYTIFSLAKKTDSQSFYDFCFGRTIYVRNNVATVCNIRLNDSTNCSLGFADTLTVAPHWALGSLLPENVTYKYSFYEFNGAEAGGLGTLLTFDGESEFEAQSADAITISTSAQSVLATKNVVVIEVYVDGDLDMTLSKIFYKF